MGWRLRINFTDGGSEELNDIFDTEEDALDEYDLYLESEGSGKKTLEMSGEEYSDADIDGYDIWEE